MSVELSNTRSKTLPTQILRLLEPPRSNAPSLEVGKLFTVVNDTPSRAWCGPTAVSAITGSPISRVRDAFRLARYGERWIDRPRSPPIMGTRHSEVTHALRSFGFEGHWQQVAGAPTLAAYLESREGCLRTHPTVVQVTGHFVAVGGWLFCDTFTKGEVVDTDDAPGRRKRVRRVFVVTSRSTDLAEIPRKERSSGQATASCTSRSVREAQS